MFVLGMRPQNSGLGFDLGLASPLEAVALNAAAWAVPVKSLLWPRLML